MGSTLNTEAVEPEDLEMLRSVFGPDLDPLGWDAVHAFEAGQGIVLPEPYRSFIAMVSDGSHSGPPDYGLLGLGELPADWGQDRAARVLSEPFPLVEPWLWEGEESPDDGGPVLVPEAVFDHGSIVLGTDGCGMYWHLIVTGEHRGHIWNICGEGAMPFGVEFGYTSGRSGFAGWVRHWAEENNWFDVL